MGVVGSNLPSLYGTGMGRSLEQDVKVIKDYLHMLTEQVQHFSGNVGEENLEETLHEQVYDTSSGVSALNASIASLRSSVASLTSGLSALSGVTADIAAIEAQINAILAQISGIEGDVTSLPASLRITSSMIDSAPGVIVYHDSRVASLVTPASYAFYIPPTAGTVTGAWLTFRSTASTSCNITVDDISAGTWLGSPPQREDYDIKGFLAAGKWHLITISATGDDVIEINVALRTIIA